MTISAMKQGGLGHNYTRQNCIGHSQGHNCIGDDYIADDTGVGWAITIYAITA